MISPVGNKPEESSHYRLASDNNNSAVGSYITQNIRGIPLSPEQEQEQLR